jgi:hypothetical protein
MTHAQAGKILQNRKTAQSIIDRAPRKEQGTRCLQAVAKIVLLYGFIIRNGEKLEPKVKNLGVGVYGVWYETAKD